MLKPLLSIICRHNRITTLTGMLAAMLIPITAAAEGSGEYWTDTHFSSGQFMYEIIPDDDTDVARLVEPVPGTAAGMTDAIVPEAVEYGGKRYPVTYIAHYVFSGMPALRSVSLPSSVRNMDYNFIECPVLEEVKMPEGITGPFMELFVSCPALRSQPLPASVKSVGACVFSDCGLTELVVDDQTYFGMDCVCNMPELTSITFKGHTDFGENSFCNLPLLKKLDLTSTGIHIIQPGVFSICPALEELYLPAGDELMIFDDAFIGCPALKAVYCPQAVPPTVKKYDPWSDRPVEFGGPTGVEGSIDKDRCVLYVPIGSAEAYRAAPQWNAFTQIVETDFASVEAPAADTSGTADAPVEFYDLHGRRVSNPSGGIFIRSQGNTRTKVIVR